MFYANWYNLIKQVACAVFVAFVSARWSADDPVSYIFKVYLYIFCSLYSFHRRPHSQWSCIVYEISWEMVTLAPMSNYAWSKVLCQVETFGSTILSEKRDEKAASIQSLKRRSPTFCPHTSPRCDAWKPLSARRVVFWGRPTFYPDALSA